MSAILGIIGGFAMIGLARLLLYVCDKIVDMKNTKAVQNE